MPSIDQYYKDSSGGPFSGRSSRHTQQKIRRSGRQQRDQNSGAGETILARPPRHPCGFVAYCAITARPVLFMKCPIERRQRFFSSARKMLLITGSHLVPPFSTMSGREVCAGRKSAEHFYARCRPRPLSRECSLVMPWPTLHVPGRRHMKSCQSKSELRPSPLPCNETGGGPRRPHRIDNALLQNSLNAYPGATGPTV